jgi:hypothetical protein
MVGNQWLQAASDLQVLATMDADHQKRILDDAALLQKMVARLP